MVSTRAVSVAAEASDIWPWLVQMGDGRGGLYSLDWLDMLFGYIHAPSADVVLPQYQGLAVGDVIPLGRGPDWPVMIVDRERALVVEPVSAGVTWCWAIIPTADWQARLVSRVRLRTGSRWMLWVLAPAIDLPWFVMERQMLRGIARRAEALARSRGAGSGDWQTSPSGVMTLLLDVVRGMPPGPPLALVPDDDRRGRRGGASTALCGCARSGSSSRVPAGRSGGSVLTPRTFRYHGSVSDGCAHDRRPWRVAGLRPWVRPCDHERGDRQRHRDRAHSPRARRVQGADRGPREHDPGADLQQAIRESGLEPADATERDEDHRNAGRGPDKRGDSQAEAPSVCPPGNISSSPQVTPTAHSR